VSESVWNSGEMILAEGNWSTWRKISAFEDRGSMCIQNIVGSLQQYMCHGVKIQKNMVNETSGPVIVSCKYGTELFDSVIWGNLLSSWVTTSFSKILLELQLMS
jgi:hypothetical protein